MVAAAAAATVVRAAVSAPVRAATVAAPVATTAVVVVATVVATVAAAAAPTPAAAETLVPVRPLAHRLAGARGTAVIIGPDGTNGEDKASMIHTAHTLQYTKSSASVSQTISLLRWYK